MEKEKVCAGEREGQRKNRVAYSVFVPSRSTAAETVGEDDDVEEESTMRHRCNKRDEILDPSHSVAPAPTNGGTAPPNFDLRHSDPDDWIFPRGSGQLFTPEAPHLKTVILAQKFLSKRRCVEIKRTGAFEVSEGFLNLKAELIIGAGSV